MSAHGPRTFTTPSPGEILKRATKRPDAVQGSDRPTTECCNEIGAEIFRPDHHRDALVARGVLLAPLVIEWHYMVADAGRFAKWLKTKDIILADARLRIDENTLGLHYFGTYAEPPEVNGGCETPSSQPICCQTLWGFANEDAMNHMFELCRGQIERTSIVENDLRDFVRGLKEHIREAGVEHFSQRVLVAPSTL